MSKFAINKISKTNKDFFYIIKSKLSDKKMSRSFLEIRLIQSNAFLEIGWFKHILFCSS